MNKRALQKYESLTRKLLVGKFLNEKRKLEKNTSFKK